MDTTDRTSDALELSMAGQDADTIYDLLTSLIVPRPIAWVSTISPSGVRNLAPYSWFTQASVVPPCVVFTATGDRDTLANARSCGEFVVNVVTADFLDAISVTAADAPREVDEFTLAGVEASPAAVVDAPRVAAAPAHLECRVVQVVPVGDSHLVVGEVVHAHVAASVRDGVGADCQRLRPVASSSGDRYLGVELLRTVAPATWEELDV